MLYQIKYITKRILFCHVKSHVHPSQSETLYAKCRSIDTDIFVRQLSEQIVHNYTTLAN